MRPSTEKRVSESLTQFDTASPGCEVKRRKEGSSRNECEYVVIFRDRKKNKMSMEGGSCP